MAVQPPSSTPSPDPIDDALAEMLSALADGEAADADIDRILANWSRSAALQNRWQSLHLTADFLRSADQPLPHRSDTDFMADLRQKLAQEPVVLAPRALPPPPMPLQPSRQAARRRWAGPSAVAAGFVLVVGLAVNLTGVPTGQGGAGGTQTAAAGPAALRVATQPVSPGASLVRVSSLDDAPVSFQRPGNPTSFQLPADMVMIRDPQLDAALAIERDAAGAASGCSR